MKTDRAMIVSLCCLAAVHTFVFSAAFPFFNVVDEQMHMDLAVYYSQAKVPRGFAPANAEAIPFLAIYGSPEFVQTNAEAATPPWKLPPESARKKFVARQNFYRDIFHNDEASQPPFYYSIAGLWWRIGEFFNLDGLALLYWLRFLNVIFIVWITWLGWFAARKIFPENFFVRIAVPALIAFMPQTAFYSINNDILSPLAFGAAFLLALKFGETEIPGARLGAFTGLSLAAAFLTKISNLPLLAVVGIFLALKIWRLAKERKLRASAPSITALAVCAGLPMAAWMAWCKINFGDFTGSSPKMKFLDWTDKPFADWFHHPIFTAGGFWYFVKGNFSTFWQGEFLWHRQPLAMPGVDLTYVLLTLGVLASALCALLRRAPQSTVPQREAQWFGFACIASSLAFFALLSVKYDFQDCFYPSRERPFFVSGRLMLGALVPFMIVFACGLDRLMKNFRAAAKFAVLAALVLFMLASEITIDWEIFPNEYNWFHM